MSNLFTAFRDWRRARFANAYARAHDDTYTAHGLTVQVPRSVDAGVRYLLAKGRPYEAEEAHFIQKCLTPGCHVLELGGSLGVIASVIQRQITDSAKHIVVEANPDLAAICARNAPDAEVLNGAVAYTDASTIAFSRGGNAHEGKLARPGEANVFEAPVLRAGKLLQRLPDGPAALVCDIEGAELPMMQNEPASTFMRLAHAVIEVHPREFVSIGASEARFLELCAQKGLRQIERRADVILFEGPAA